MGQQTGPGTAEARACPFQEPASGGCAASPRPAAKGQEDADRRCATPDHGDCTLYLVKLLTSLKPHPFACQRDLWSK